MREAKTATPERERSLAHDASAASDLPVVKCRFRYIVCSTPRTGSTLVCRALRATGKAGQPMEFFHPSLIRAFLARFGKKDIAVAEFLDFLESHRSTADGVFGLKMHLDQLTRSYKDDEKRKGFLRRFDRVILMSRRNKLAQAISYTRAIQTQHWEADRPDAVERARKAATRYDAASIALMLGALVSEDQKWREALSLSDVPYHAVSYEKLVADFAGAMAGIARFLGFDDLTGQSFQRLPLVKMGDEVNIEWERRFLAEMQGQSPADRVR